MKKIWITLVMLFALMSVCQATEKGVETPANCKQCGMNRTAFAQSRMVVTYKDGSSSGTCSLNCVVTDLKAGKGKEIKSLQVGDYDSKKLIDAKSATWVIGGKKQGVMTPVAKWAFAGKTGAEKFIKENGGKLVLFDDALKATEKEQAEHDNPKGHSGHKM